MAGYMLTYVQRRVPLKTGWPETHVGKIHVNYWTHHAGSVCKYILRICGIRTIRLAVCSWAKCVYIRQMPCVLLLSTLLFPSLFSPGGSSSRRCPRKHGLRGIERRDAALSQRLPRLTHGTTGRTATATATATASATASGTLVANLVVVYAEYSSASGGKMETLGYYQKKT